MKCILLTTLGVVFAVASVRAQEQSVPEPNGTAIDNCSTMNRAYNELSNPHKADAELWAALKGRNSLGWGSTDVRYAQEQPQGRLPKEIALTAWRGERVNAQFVISSAKGVDEVGFTVSDFVHVSDKSKRIGSECVASGFVRYVMTDEPNKDGETACGHRPDHSMYDSSLVADVIDHHALTMRVEPMTTRAIWFTVWVPQEAASGVYRATVNVLGKRHTLRIRVIDRVLPMPDEWTFHLDLWQNPFAIARYYGVELWSKAHFEVMKPYVKVMNNMGVKVITASIMHKPWNGQTEDPYETMVTWIKRADGSWVFDYTVFDMWVEYMMANGVTEQINCYSMIPWRLSYQYLDQATNTLKFVATQPGETAFNEMWGAMLKSFAAHLKSKGWFEKTCISIDERPMEAVLKTIDLVRASDKDFKVSFAGVYHEELATQVYDYSLAQRTRYPKNIKQLRAAKGLVTTFYTCCSEAYPNMFTFSAPAESAWLPIHAAGENLDGYLRWAFNHWVKEPLLDSRFRTWAAGDTYMIYPGGRSSIRIERMVEGVQAYEKILLLRGELSAAQDAKALDGLNELLSKFHEKNVKENGAAVYVNELNDYINTIAVSGK